VTFFLCVFESGQIQYTLSGHYVKLSNSSVLTMHETLVTDWLMYVQNITQPSFVGPFDVVGPRHLLTMPMP